MKVSIIIPVYQVASYIEGCLCSVMGQTYKGKMECLLIDDCGTDESIAIAERMVAAYEGPIHFSFLYHEQNRGLSAARNTGIDAATGDYVYFLDSDDELSPDCIEKLASPVINDATIEMVMGNYTIHTDGCQIAPFEQPIMKQQEELTSIEAVRNYYFDRRGFYVYAWNKLIRKDFLTKNQLYFKEGLLWEDYLWTFFVIKYLRHLYIIPDSNYKYYKRHNSITTRASKKEKAHHMGLAYVEIANNFTEKEMGREAKRYAKGLSSCYVAAPESSVLRQAMQLYIKALQDSHDIKNCLMLRMTVSLSRFAIGRELLRLGEIIMEKIIWR